MLFTDLKKGNVYQFAPHELRKAPGLYRGLYLHNGDSSWYLGEQLYDEDRHVPWNGHEELDVTLVILSDKELYELPSNFLQ